MKIALLADAESWYARDLMRAAAGRCELVPIAFGELQATAAAGGLAFQSGRQELNLFDALLVRSMPPGSLEQIIFRMDVLGRMAAQGQTVINPPRALEAAIDKYLATALIAQAGLRVPRTLVCQTPAQALAAFAELGGDVVVKPIFGGEGRGIARLQDDALAERAFKMLASLGAILYVQEFIPHEGADVRVLCIGDESHMIRRRNPLDWRTNVARGARAERMEYDASLAAIAQQAMQATGCLLAGIDLLPGRDGELYVLEVNGVPGWKGLAAALNIDIASRVIDLTMQWAGGLKRGHSTFSAS